MTRDSLDPPLGTPHPDAEASSRLPDSEPFPGRAAEDPARPQIPPYGSTSGDELSVLLSESLTKLKPDPLLGEFSAGQPDPPVVEASTGEPFDGASAVNAFTDPTPVLPVIDPNSAAPPGSLPARGGGPSALSPGPAGSFDALSGIDLFAGPVAGPAPFPTSDAGPSETLPAEATAGPPPQPASFDAFPAADAHERRAFAASLEASPPAATAGVAASDVFPTLVPDEQRPPHGDSFESFPAIASSEPTPQAASTDAFPALDLSAPPSSNATSGPAGPAEDEDDEDEEDDEDLPPRRHSLLTFFLFSYASAVTLGLLWVLVTGRSLRQSSEDLDPFPAVDARADPGKHAGEARKVAPQPPIAADHLASLGKPIRLGSLEVTPLRVATGRVAMSRAIGDERQDGGAGALKLRLRLKNVSADTVFTPLDEAFLRERERGVLDSLIETSNGGQIGMYPLAVSSEWSIVGQEFKELQPGEAYETEVVSASGAGGQLSPELTWRLRLRTGINQTDTVGVRFTESDVRPGS